MASMISLLRTQHKHKPPVHKMSVHGHYAEQYGRKIDVPEKSSKMCTSFFYINLLIY
jgi:hypothetical protein